MKLIVFSKLNDKNLIETILYGIQFGTACEKRMKKQHNLTSRKVCRKVTSLQCPTCKYKFTCASSKSRHIKMGNCV